MPGTPQVTKTGPRTYSPIESITGGQIVEARAGAAVGGKGRCGVAAAGSVKTLGVALFDAQAPEALVTTPATVAGRPVLDASPLPTVLGVADGGIETKVKYAADASFGDRLVVGAGGGLTPAGANPDARTVVGKCTQPGGVAVATNAIGLAEIF